MSGDDPHEVDRLLGDLRRWSADARVSDAARARTRERWLQRQAEEQATLSGVALDLAEQGNTVVLKTASGNTYRGRLVAVARDVWVVRSDASGATLVATDAVASLRPQAEDDSKPAPEAAGARPAPLTASMADMLTELAAEQPLVRVVVHGEAEAMVGELRSVGVDVATLRVGGAPPSTVYVRLGSVSELSVLGSG